MASSAWGQLSSYDCRYYLGQKKRYGVSGNNFICVFEIVRKDYFEGKKIKAKSLLAGGNSGNPLLAHFTDQLEMYTKGQFKEVLFYKEDVLKKNEKGTDMKTYYESHYPILFFIVAIAVFVSILFNVFLLEKALIQQGLLFFFMCVLLYKIGRAHD